MPLTCPNASGECASDGCSARESPWYGKRPNKKCKACYDRGRKEGAAAGSPATGSRGEAAAVADRGGCGVGAAAGVGAGVVAGGRSVWGLVWRDGRGQSRLVDWHTWRTLAHVHTLSTRTYVVRTVRYDHRLTVALRPSQLTAH